MDPTNTPTPTLTPTLTTTPRWDWLTPTPMELPTVDPAEALVIEDPNLIFIEVAEYGVQTYNMANQTGSIDNLYWILIVAIVMLGIRNIIKRVRDL